MYFVVVDLIKLAISLVARYLCGEYVIWKSCFLLCLGALNCIYLRSLWSQFVRVVCCRTSEIIMPITLPCLQPGTSVAMQDVYLHSVQYLFCSLISYLFLMKCIICWIIWHVLWFVHLNFKEHCRSHGKFAVNLGAVSLKRCALFFTK